MIEGQLFRRRLSTPLLKCIGPSETWYVLTEVHEGSCGHHIGGKSLARKSLRAGYFWRTMNKDVADHVKKCQKCQEHSPLSHIPADAREAKQNASRYSIIEGQLFRRELSNPLLKCIGSSETWYVLTEVHEGSCGHHIGGKSLARKSL